MQTFSIKKYSKELQIRHVILPIYMFHQAYYSVSKKSQTIIDPDGVTSYELWTGIYKCYHFKEGENISYAFNVDFNFLIY